MLKNIASLKTFPLDFTNIICLSTIDKYNKRPTYLSCISFIEFVTNYAIVNLREKRNFFHIIRFVHYNEQLLLFIPSFDNEHTFKGDHSTWNVAYNMHEILINLLRKHTHTHTHTHSYISYNNNTYTTNWENIRSQAFPLTTKLTQHMDG